MAHEPSQGDKTAEVIRKMLDHEADVTHHRMSWLGTFQGFLFAALGFSWQKQSKGLVVTFCLLGLATAVLTWVGLYSASVATRDLLRWWRSHIPKDYQGPPVIGRELSKDARLWRYLMTPWAGMVLCLVAAWTTALVIALQSSAVCPVPNR